MLVHWWFYAAVVTGFVCVVFEDGLTSDGVYCSLRAGEAHAYSPLAYQNKQGEILVEDDPVNGHFKRWGVVHQTLTISRSRTPKRRYLGSAIMHRLRPLSIVVMAFQQRASCASFFLSSLRAGGCTTGHQCCCLLLDL